VDTGVPVGWVGVRPNCPRRAPNLGCGEAFACVPRPGKTSPVPEWKRLPAVALPAPAAPPHRAADRDDECHPANDDNRFKGVNHGDE
jgi:hypothetical protein